jgi:hypothetical protein
VPVALPGMRVLVIAIALLAAVAGNPFAPVGPSP